MQSLARIFRRVFAVQTQVVDRVAVLRDPLGGEEQVRRVAEALTVVVSRNSLLPNPKTSKTEIMTQIASIVYPLFNATHSTSGKTFIKA